MKSIATGSVAIAAACMLTSTLYAADGIHITAKTTSNGNTETSQIQLDANHMRADANGLDGANAVVIFDGTKQVMDIVNLDKKSYMEITKADLDKIAGQISGAMSQMNQAMANMPPDQRARVEAMMRGRMSQMGAAAPPKIEYRKTGTDHAGKWTCDKYEGSRNGQKVSELCTVPASTLGFTAADFAVTQQMRDFFSKVVPMHADQMLAIGSPEAGFSGVPVRSITYGAGGGIDSTTELTDVSRANIPESAFAVPSGFQKEAFGPMGRGR